MQTDDNVQIVRGLAEATGMEEKDVSESQRNIGFETIFGHCGVSCYSGLISPLKTLQVSAGSSGLACNLWEAEVGGS